MTENPSKLLRALGKACSKQKLRKIASLAELNDEESTVLLRHYGDGATSEQIAEEMNISLRSYHKRREWLAYKMQSFVPDNMAVLNLWEAINLVRFLGNDLLDGGDGKG